MNRRAAFLFLSLLFPLHLAAVEPIKVDFNLHPQRAEAGHSIRLLPIAPDLKDGNAAVVMLRIIWEQQNYVQTVVPQFTELLELPYNDPRIAKTIEFDGFQHQLRRAAYMRSAEWSYPLNEEPLGMILLGDVQGMRNFAGRGMSLWVGTQIAEGKLDSAREGVLTQLACARHLARTPLIINHLVAYAIAGRALDRLEIFISQPKAPNLYWALAKLPDSIGDTEAAVQWEGEMLPRSLPSLQSEMTLDDDAGWKKVADEFLEFMQLTNPRSLNVKEAAALQGRLLIAARTYLQDKQEFTGKELAKLSKEAIVMRWVLALDRELHNEIESAYSLPVPLALARLAEIEAMVEEITKSTKAPASPFPQRSSNVYVAVHRFDRRVKLLQTIESIRDHAAHHGGALPKSLMDLRLPAPNDPMTNQPFEYSLIDGTATVQWAVMPELKLERQIVRAYTLRVVD